MRDPNRIKPLLEKLEKIWNTKGADQLRFGQLIFCIFNGTSKDIDQIWNLEDEEWSKLIDIWINKEKKE